MTLASGTSPRPRATPASQSTSPIQTTVDNVSGPVEADSPEDSYEGLNQLDDEHQNESQIYETQNDEDRVGHPLPRASTN